MTETCGNCRFYRRSDDPNAPLGTGGCHWRPPTVMILPGPQGQPMQLNVWPGMGVNDWCGQWESVHNGEVDSTFTARRDRTLEAHGPLGQ